MTQTDKRLPLKKAVATVILLACLAAQASTVVTGTKVWPFMAYCMYADSWPAPPTSRRRSVVAVFDDGSIQTIDPNSVGLNSFIWDRHYIRPLTKGEPGAMQIVADRIEKFNDHKVVRIEMHTEVHQIIDGEHLMKLETEVLGELPTQGETP